MKMSKIVTVSQSKSEKSDKKSERREIQRVQ